MSKSSVSNSTKNIVTLLVLLFAYPIGVIVMWLWTGWKQWVKVLVTLPIILGIVVGVFAGISKSVDLNGSIHRAECSKRCENSKLQQTCTQQCMDSFR